MLFAQAGKDEPPIELKKADPVLAASEQLGEVPSLFVDRS